MVLRIPEKEPFSIISAPAQQAPGLNGTASGAATVDAAAGSAQIAAKVIDSGTASGMFQLGHALRNETDQQVDVAVRVNFDFEYACRADPPSGLDAGVLSLSVYARNSRNVILREVQIARHSTANGAVEERGGKTLSFVVTSGAREGLNVYVAGSATAETKEQRSAAVELRVSNLKMEFTSAAPARPPTSSASATASSKP